jgi:hypothetical protein
MSGEESLDFARHFDASESGEPILSIRSRVTGDTVVIPAGPIRAIACGLPTTHPECARMVKNLKRLEKAWFPVS